MLIVLDALYEHIVRSPNPMSFVAPNIRKKTALNARHRELGARMIGFGGWDMPVEYASGISNEHHAVRTKAGLFDVSHMGEIEIAGVDALAVVQRITCNDASVLTVGQAQYSAITTEAGTVIDDILVYKLASTHYLLVVNASNIAKDQAWVANEISSVNDAVLVNSSSRYALLALQGPLAQKILQPLTGTELDSIPYYWFTNGEVANVRAMISRTGYTGEDGFELFIQPQAAVRVWDALLDVGAEPIGLGARDTLRLEAAMRLYGNDIDETTTVLEAGLGWIVGWQKQNFIGKDALITARETGLTRQLAGFEMIDRGIARQGYDVYSDERIVGSVTSGTQTPFLNKAIGMAYVPTELSKNETEIIINVRGRYLRARIIQMPFYKRRRK